MTKEIKTNMYKNEELKYLELKIDAKEMEIGEIKGMLIESYKGIIIRISYEDEEKRTNVCKC